MGDKSKECGVWVDPEFRKVLLDEIGEKRVGLLDDMHRRSVEGWSIMNAVVGAYFRARREGDSPIAPFDKFCVEFARKDAIKRTNEMSIKAHGEACSRGPVVCGPVILDEEDI